VTESTNPEHPVVLPLPEIPDVTGC
jgi:hypothetical protein